MASACMKKCSKCKLFLDKSQFWKESRTVDGLCPRCKSCKNKAQNNRARQRREARRYEKDRMKVLARQRTRDILGPAVGSPCGVMNCKRGANDWHHLDYTYPLAVIPLCQEHHEMIHE